MNIEIIPCSADQVDTLLALSRETFSRAFSHLNTAETMRAYLTEAFTREKLLRELNQPHSAFYFLYADGELAGYLKLNQPEAQSDVHDPNTLEIERIYVKQAVQGLGLGRALITFAEEKARELGKTALWLGVWQENQPGIAFYQRMGFRIAGTHPFCMGEEIQTDWIMRKDLVVQGNSQTS